MWPRPASSALALIVAAVVGSAPAPAQSRRFSFMPNQLAANAWYRPGTPPSLINGHLD